MNFALLLLMSLIVNVYAEAEQQLFDCGQGVSGIGSCNNCPWEPGGELPLQEGPQFCTNDCYLVGGIEEGVREGVAAECDECPPSGCVYCGFFSGRAKTCEECIYFDETQTVWPIRDSYCGGDCQWNSNQEKCVEVIPTESPTIRPIEIEQTKIPVDAFLCDAGKSKLSDQAKKFQIGQNIRVCVEPEPEPADTYSYKYAVTEFKDVACTGEGSNSFDIELNQVEDANDDGTKSFVFLLQDYYMAEAGYGETSTGRMLYCSGKAVITRTRIYQIYERALEEGVVQESDFDMVIGIEDSAADTPADEIDIQKAGLTPKSVSISTAWIVLVSVCTFFVVVAIGSMDWLVCLPSIVRNLCLLKQHNAEGHVKVKEGFLSARNSADWFSIAMSFYASSMGVWVVFWTTGLGARPDISWFGIVGFSLASALPGIVLCFLGPSMKEMYNIDDPYFSATDFARERYGRIMQLSVVIISGFYMLFKMVSELNLVSNTFVILTEVSFDTSSFEIAVIVVIGCFTLTYTAIGGLPAKIVIARIQGPAEALFMVVLAIAVCTSPENRVTKMEFSAKNQKTPNGFMCMITLFFAILCAHLFNQANWQSVWAAESDTAMKKGFLSGSFFLFLTTMLYGVLGKISYARYPEAYDSGEKTEFLAFFDLLMPVDSGWHIFMLVYVTTLATSSIDSLQNGLNCMFSRDALRFGYKEKPIAWVLLVVFTVPAICLACLKKDAVSKLIWMFNLVCTTAVLPCFLGLQKTDKLRGLLPAPTELGAFFGILSGIVSVIITKDSWVAGGGEICGRTTLGTMISFVATPSVAGVMTYIFTHLDLCLRKERARRPFIELEFDKDSHEKSTPNVDTQKNNQDEEAIILDDKEPKDA